MNDADRVALSSLSVPSKAERAAALAARGYTKLENVEHEGVKKKLTLAYKLHGDTVAPYKIVFINGLATAGHFLDDLVALFLSTPIGERCQVLTMDNRGAGESSIPSGRYTTSSMAHDWKAVVAHLKWERPHVMGVSMGGMIAQEFALIDLAKIASLSLFVTHAGEFFTAWAPMSGAFMVAAQLFSSSPADKVMRQMQILFSKATMSQPGSPKYIRLRDAFADRMKSIGGGVDTLGAFASQYAATNTHRVSDRRLREIRDSRVPVMVLRGDEDHLVKVGNSDKLAKVLGVDCIVLPDTGHGMMEESPGAVVQEMERFLKTVVNFAE